MATSSETAARNTSSYALVAQMLAVIEAVWWCVVVLTVLTAVLSWAGRLAEPPAAGAWGMVLGAALLTVALRVLAAYVSLPRRLATTASILPLMITVAMSAAGVHPSHLVGWLIIMAVLEASWWTGWPYRWLLVHAAGRRNPLGPSKALSSGESTPPADLSSDPIQHTIRYRRDGFDVVWGRWRLDYGAGTQRLVLHVPVHPPMEQIPSVEVEAECQGKAAYCQVTQREVYGVRVEARLAAPAATDGQGWIEFVLRAPTQSTGQAG